MDNFISKLNSTLNAANISKNENELEDIKDEVLDDLEEEAIQAENIKDIKASGGSVAAAVSSKPKRTSFFKNALDQEMGEDNNNDDDDDGNNDVAFVPKIGAKSNINNTMGATNHMHNRINSLER